MNQFENEQRDEIELSQLFRIIKPYIAHVIIFSIICVLASFLYTKVMIKPTYQSSATIVVNNRKEGNSNITNDEINSAKNLVNLYGVVIKSDVVLLPVVSAVDSNVSVNDLAKKVTVSAVDNTQAMRITVKEKDPYLAQRYTKEIIAVAPSVIVDKVEAGSVKIISEPTFSDKPVAPNLKMNLAIAFILGLFVSIGVVFLSYFLDNTIKSEEDINNLLGIPVIGIIPKREMPKAKKRESVRSRR